MLMARSPARSLTFGQSKRLKHRSEFSHTRLHGRRVVLGCLIANWRVAPERQISRLGVVTPKKIGSAVERSRARRLLREVFRLNQHHLKQPLDLVLIARASIAGQDFGKVQSDFVAAMKQADQWIQSQ